jgi:hypothetical protein
MDKTAEDPRDPEAIVQCSYELACSQTSNKRTIDG